MLSEPPQTDDDDDNVDEAKVRQDGRKIQVQLLVRLELFEIDAVG